MTCPQGKSLKPIVSRCPQISARKISAEHSERTTRILDTCCTIEHFQHTLPTFDIRNYRIPQSFHTEAYPEHKTYNIRITFTYGITLLEKFELKISSRVE